MAATVKLNGHGPIKTWRMCFLQSHDTTHFLTVSYRTKVFLTHLIRTEDALYAIGISRGIMDLSIQVTSLNPETGEWLNAVEIPASITSVDDYIPLKVGANSKGGVARTAGLAWLEGK